MTEREVGYIYRRANTSGDALRALLAGAKRGWTWTPATMQTLAESGSPLSNDEGRAFNQDMEVRWTRRGGAYDVLVLALREQDLQDFTRLRPSIGDWVVHPTTYRLQRPAATDDETVDATAFLAPDGAMQFVALIGSDVQRSSS